MKTSRLSSAKLFLTATGLTFLFSSGLILFILLNSVPAQAKQDRVNEHQIIDDISAVGQGTLFFRQGSGYSKATQLSINVAMTVTGMINRVGVTQSFTNPTDSWQEGIYVFPLPGNAAVDRLRLRIGKRIIEGQIKEKQAAKKTYQQAKQQGKRAALTEQERPNIFTTSVANIAPHETIKVEIEYQQIVNYDNGVFSLRFPMVTGARYIPGKQQINGFAGSGWAVNTDRVADAARITPPVMQAGADRKNEVTIEIDLDAGLALDKIDSTYHEIEINRQNDRYLIKLEHESTLANRDFELTWQPHPGLAPKAALFTEKNNADTYSMIMLLPPAVEKSETISREVIYVIDTSGSMGGQSIIQARAALELALSRLKPGDRFNVIQFNSFTSSLFGRSVPVTPETLQQAISHVRSLEADGGTEMAAALRTALSHQTENNDLRQVVFLTDGSIGNEQALFEIIQNRLGRSRLFTIGIGSAPNSYFMQRAAGFGRGTYTYIGKIEEVQTRMQALFEKIENPVLKDIHIDWGPTGNPPDIEAWPQKIADLYRGEPLLITARADQLPAQIQISGRAADEQWTANLKLNGGQNRQGIAALWARNKIAALMEQKRDAEFESIKQIIIQTALQHRLVSQFTSLVAVDVTPVRPTDKKPETNAIPVHLPDGWEYSKVFGHPFPAGATDARLVFIIGLMLMVFALLLYLHIGTDKNAAERTRHVRVSPETCTAFVRFCTSAHSTLFKQ